MGDLLFLSPLKSQRRYSLYNIYIYIYMLTRKKTLHINILEKKVTRRDDQPAKLLSYDLLHVNILEKK